MEPCSGSRALAAAEVGARTVGSKRVAALLCCPPMTVRALAAPSSRIQERLAVRHLGAQRPEQGGVGPPGDQGVRPH
jgi:hypothetical protein